MSAWLAAAYPWVKAAHVVAAIAWMAGLLYLPRLFVYHCRARPGGEAARTFEVMERRLLRAIATPAMLATLALGLVLAATPGAVDWSAGWPWVKLAALAGLFVLHGLDVVWVRSFAAGRNRRSAGFYRAVNELPTLAMIVVVAAAVVEPF